MNKKVTKMNLLINCMKPIALVLFIIFSFAFIVLFIFAEFTQAIILSLIIFGLYVILILTISCTPLTGIYKIIKQEKISSTSFDEDMQYVDSESFFKKENQYLMSNDWACVITGINISVINRRCVDKVRVGSEYPREYLDIKMIDGKKMKFYIWNAPELLDEIKVFLLDKNKLL